MPSGRITNYTIELPADMAGEFSMDFLPQAVVSLNGENVNLTFGSIRLSPGINHIEVNNKNPCRTIV